VGLDKGFKSQQKVAIRLEKSLDLYERGLFSDSEETIYPESRQNAGKEGGEGEFCSFC